MYLRPGKSRRERTIWPWLVALAVAILIGSLIAIACFKGKKKKDVSQPTDGQVFSEDALGADSEKLSSQSLCDERGSFDEVFTDN